MPKPKALASPRQAQDLPTDIYLSVVDSLFEGAGSLILGASAALVATLLTAVRTGEWLLYACAAAIGLVTLTRVLLMRAYAHASPTVATVEAARVWERRYIVGASAHVGLLGVFCLIAFVRTDDPFVQLLSFSTILAYIVGIAGRNFARDALVVAQITAAGVPMSLALIVAGDVYWVIVAIILLPLFLSIRMSAVKLRETLHEAVIAARDNELLAARFDTALNNMPHGLAMYDERQRLDVWNRRLAEQFGLVYEGQRIGSTFRELLLESAHHGMISVRAAERFAADFEACLSGRSDEELILVTEAGRSLALTLQTMQNGGSVLLVEDVTERKSAEARIRQLARYDALTGLPNRTFFRDQMDAVLAARLENHEPCAVLFVDLDQFKQVNDTLGHSHGDKLLCAVSDRLRAIASQTDVLGRFGGDEFVVLQASASGAQEAGVLARRIVHSLSQPYDIEGHQVVIGASIGIAIAPEDGTDADKLLKNADMALYRAKSDGRGAWRYFEAEMDIKLQARRSLEMDLRAALENDAFQLWYQPLYNIKQQRFTTCEALLRWNHPERGYIQPSEFIPIAEEMGLIVDIGNWVLRQACLECVKWPAHISVAVNLSPIQFRRGGLLGSVRQALAASGLSPARLELEITESVLLQDLQSTRVALHQLRELGVTLALDDFGTGYSSLSYLHSFPLQKVKIDRSFLSGLRAGDKSMVLLQGVARLSNQLGMTVTVEGVETEDQLALVTSGGYVDEIQGFLFSKPVPALQLRPFLASGRQRIEQVA